VYDGAYGGFSMDEDWIKYQSPKIDIWNDTVFKNHNDIYIIDIEGEVEQVTTPAGVRG
jgi:alanine-alpha-ketoisovalerate/valine-pyruvate aminotransferase